MNLAACQSLVGGAWLGLLSTGCVELVWAGRGPGTTKGVWTNMRRRAKTDGAT